MLKYFKRGKRHVFKYGVENLPLRWTEFIKNEGDYVFDK